MKWISVDVVPEKSADKHLLFDGYEIYLGWMIAGQWHVCNDGITIDGDACFGTDDTYGPFTHWRSLPAPPESES
jgi:hypothetical protein